MANMVFGTADFAQETMISAPGLQACDSESFSLSSVSLAVECGLHNLESQI
jgi:hypothetical protein